MFYDNRVSTNLKNIDYQLSNIADILEKQSNNSHNQLLEGYIAKETIKNKLNKKINEYDTMIKATYKDTTYHGQVRRDTCTEIMYMLIELLNDLIKED